MPSIKREDVYNENTILPAVVAALMGVGLTLIDAGFDVAMVAAGVSACVCDLSVRAAHSKHGDKFWNRDAGGHFFHLPVWLVGLILAGLGLLARIALFFEGE